MRTFKDIYAVEEWLAPMDYHGFWFAIEPYGLDIQERADCDQQLKDGVKLETMLDVLKGFARMALVQKYGLKHRDPAPWLKLVETH